MNDSSRTKQELIEELSDLKKKIKKLEKSEFNHTEDALRESEEKFRRITENMSDFVLELDAQGIVKYVSPSHMKTFGESINNIIGGSVFDYIHPEDRGRVVAEYMEALQTKTDREAEFRFKHQDGHYLWIRSSGHGIFNEAGENIANIINSQDITERKQVEKALRESEEKYRSLLENASDAILLADMQGNIVEANRKAEELWGWTKEELLQMHYTQLHPLPEIERTIAAFQEIIEKNTDHLSGGFIQRKDGNIVPVDITSNVIEYAGRKVGQASFRNISEHKQTENMLERLVRERTVELSRNNEQLKLEVKERKHTEAAMKKKTRELKQLADKLKEMNTALKILLKQREDDKNDLEEKVTSNVKELLLPYIEEMKNRKIDSKSKVSLSILETNLQNIISPFTQRLSSKYLCLTPREVQVADLIRQGKSTKEIARFIGISANAISIYRYHIREKLGLIKQKINLKTYLRNLS